MKLKYIKGDITKVQEKGIIIHGVNCQKKIGSGIAKALYEKWPVIKDTYLSVPFKQMQLGLIQISSLERNLYVANCWTQNFFGRDGKRYASISAIRKCLAQVLVWCNINSVNKIYSPKIGCGLGGLDWELDVESTFKEIQETQTQTVQITIYSLN